jgi:GNAT superfamily N-acetyltransferase
VTADAPYRYREASAADNRAMHDVFLETVAEIDRRLGSADAVDDKDPVVREQSWERWQSLFEHLMANGARAWVAEDDSGRVVGYARSLDRDGVRELTEFFVLPAAQGGGVGRELLGRAFSPEGVRHRTIIATLELAALGRYLKTGLTAHGLVLYVSNAPREHRVETDLAAEPIVDSPRTLAALARIDRRILGHTRRPEHGWLQGNREGFLFRRDGRAVGYGYVGERSGPVAAFDPSDMPAILAHLESRAAAANLPDVGFWLPSLNAAATAHLLGRGFRIDPFIATFFSDAPEVRLDRYLITSPPFFV